jgi:DUF4097 and DUF4098 domain-containing protein YvlB
MRRGSVIGPLILIGVGALFLLRNLWPEIPFVELISRYWPFVLIAWGGIRLIEILLWAIMNKPIPRNGVSGGEWLLVFLICIVGATMYTARNYSSWFPNRGAWQRIALKNMGEPYDYTLAPVEKPCAKNCRVLIESFNGNAKITGTSDMVVKASGQETIRSWQQADADNANKQTPLELIQQGDQIIIRTNQDRASERSQPSEDLEISVPAGSSIEAHGRYGDFDIQNVSGNVDINSDNAGVRLDNIGGNVRIDLRASDIVRAVGVKGSVDLKGRGQDLELQDITGPVTVVATFVGQVQLRNLMQPLRYESGQTSLSFEKLPGQVQMSLGEFTANNVIGPLRLNGRSRDVQLSNVTQSLELTLDRGDIELRPGKNLPKMQVRTRSGDIELALPPGAKFDLRASTERGDAENDFGDPLRVEEYGHGQTIQGSTGGGGPQLRLDTGRGSISVHKAASDDVTFPNLPSAPNPPKPANPPKPLTVERE